MQEDDRGCVGWPCGPVEYLNAVCLDGGYAGDGRHCIGFFCCVYAGGKDVGVAFVRFLVFSLEMSLVAVARDIGTGAAYGVLIRFRWPNKHSRFVLATAYP